MFLLLIFYCGLTFNSTSIITYLSPQQPSQTQIKIPLRHFIIHIFLKRKKKIKISKQLQQKKSQT